MPSLACKVGDPLLLEIDSVCLIERVVSYACINGTCIVWLLPSLPLYSDYDMKTTSFPLVNYSIMPFLVHYIHRYMIEHVLFQQLVYMPLLRLFLVECELFASSVRT